MLPRQDITEMFSTFVELEGDRFSKWLVDIRLRRNMQNCLDSSPEVSKEENWWAIYWHKRWQSLSQSNNFPKMHLLAYLQEPCYQVSQKTTALLTSSPYGIADYFQMVNAEVETVLKYFNPGKSSSLKAYFKMAIKSRLRDILRQRKEADFCTNWALLRKVSKKMLGEALENAGLSALQIEQYRLACICFKELYVQNQPGGTASLPEPTPQLWQAIANLYNHSRCKLTQQTSECTAQIIESWLNNSVTYVRAYSFPSVKSLNSLNSDDNANQIVDLPDLSEDSTIADMIATEDWLDRQNQISQMLGVLSRANKALDAKSQKVLKLYYQEEMTQQQIMRELQMSQPTVSRKLVKARESLLGALIQWSQDLNISVNPNQIKDMSNILEEFLFNWLGGKS